MTMHIRKINCALFCVHNKYREITNNRKQIKNEL